MREPILFAVREGRTVSRDTWERFVAATKRQGSTPAAVLRSLIERYAKEHSDDQQA
jgi:hypothetical protein